MSEDLGRAVRAVVRDCHGVVEGEDVLVICNPATRELGDRMRTEAAQTGADSVLTEMAERTSHAAEERILGTVYVAFGASAGIGGTVQVPVHLDCVVTKPTVEVDGTAIVRGGELLVGDR